MENSKKEQVICAESDSGIFRNVVIVNGEIVRTSKWTEDCSGYRVLKGESGFIAECKTSIRHIADINPRELKDIYHALAEGPMKDFCKKIQTQKIAELQF
ncbi:MAG: hypothetical protein HFJ41_05690 [Clostridia bacterium]|nr:hypothetical protein [Clostridia bacterium]